MLKDVNKVGGRGILMLKLTGGVSSRGTAREEEEEWQSRNRRER